jgi:hypothetical protein
MIDVCAKELVGEVKELQEMPPPIAGAEDGVPLGEYDESERLAVKKSGTLQYRQLHNKMTNALKRKFVLKPDRGRSDNRYDVRLRNYDGVGRDLLIEVKPEPDKGSLRIAIGQLYDYRRFLDNSLGTDLAVLTIGKPEQSYVDLLLVDLGITVLWFEDESCQVLRGRGNAWPPNVVIQD